MPADLDELVRYAAENRAYIATLRDEVKRLRDRQHEQAATVAGLAILIEPLRQLPEAVDGLRETIERLGKRAVSRPRVTTLTMLAAWASVTIALVALLVVVFRKG